MAEEIVMECVLLSTVSSIGLQQGELDDDDKGTLLGRESGDDWE